MLSMSITNKVDAHLIQDTLFKANGTTTRDVSKEINEELRTAISEGRVSKKEARQIKKEIVNMGFESAMARRNNVEKNVTAYKNGDESSLGEDAAQLLRENNLDINDIVELANTHGLADYKLSQKQQKSFMDALNSQIEGNGGKPLSKKDVRKLLNGIGFKAPNRLESFIWGYADSERRLLGISGDSKSQFASDIAGKRVSVAEAKLEILNEWQQRDS